MRTEGFHWYLVYVKFLLDCRIDERLNNFPNTQHMAYQKYLNSVFDSFDLQEIIHYYIDTQLLL